MVSNVIFVYLCLNKQRGTLKTAPLVMKTFIIYITSFAGLENEYETRYEVVSDCIGNALNYAKGKHPHNISEYDYWILD